jgi:FlaA1/EpsC-like NDP-sugar epimerase
MKSIADPLLALPRGWKRLLAVGVDVVLCVVAVWLAYYLRLGVWTPMIGRPMLPIVLSIGLAIPIFAVFGLYRVVFRHAGVDVISTCAQACAAYGIAYSSLITVYAFDTVPRTVGLMQPVLLFLGMSLTRLVASFILDGHTHNGHHRASATRVLIYGAGSAGRQLAAAMAASDEMNIIGFIDDDHSLHGNCVRGLRVYAPHNLQHYVARLGVSEILLAIPSAKRSRRKEIIDDLKTIGVSVRMLPGLMELAHGTVQASDLREVTITDLLQRDPVDYDSTALREHIAGNVILVTGAGGSIGSELCRQIMDMQPHTLLLVEISEYALYCVHRELEAVAGAACLVPLLASVTDETRMDAIIGTWKPRMVFHAAAYKHVPLVEHNPLEGLRNNVIGTALVAGLAARHKIRDFVLVSTDKAVRPTNIMGASKRFAELVLQGLSGTEAACDTCFSMVRFGNVLGSSGSVVPLFTSQIHQGGPVTITHPEITRYFMTIPEAVHLVLQAGAMAHGGEVFVLDMGEPVKIYDLACNMIRLSGLTVRDGHRPDGDIEIQFVGLRPGEKLYEELLIGDDPLPTPHPQIMKATEQCLPWEEMRDHLDQLRALITAGDVPGVRALLVTLIDGFRPTSDVVDWVSLEGMHAAGELSSPAPNTPARRLSALRQA